MYQNKIMLITGASSGIGKVIATYFANLGINLILTYHKNFSDVDKLKNELVSKYNINVDCFYLDLASEKSIKKLVSEVRNKYKKINYLINNAAISLDNYLYDKTKDEFMKVLEINVVGTFLMMKYFNKMVKDYIINISSTDGIDTGSIHSLDYNVSKAGINILTKTFSLDSSNKIISICPNWINTLSTNEMNQDYLNSELKRIKQDKLISEITIPKVIDNCIKNNISTGSIIRIEGDLDVREIS
jgi:3-oxoacyl-[acyl-carrier protein] reductase